MLAYQSPHGIFTLEVGVNRANFGLDAEVYWSQTDFLHSQFDGL
ncbi:hypothetical protein GFS31_44120 (plasmid) [Leptolyngbya sp. BL0902]|nr:hypothetical protein GFS31_44120 [Leptolyngbya sp. BL0902]